MSFEKYEKVPMIEIESERLRMRAWRNADYPFFVDYFADEEMAEFLGGTRTREESWRTMAAYIGHWHLNGFGYWAVEEKDTQDFVGGVGLWKSPNWPELELGYWILRTMHGKGYATEAAVRAKEFAFNELKVDTLVSYIDLENEASKRVAERLGGIYEKTIELLNFGPHLVYRYAR